MEQYVDAGLRQGRNDYAMLIAFVMMFLVAIAWRLKLDVRSPNLCLTPSLTSDISATFGIEIRFLPCKPSIVELKHGVIYAKLSMVQSPCGWSVVHKEI